MIRALFFAGKQKQSKPPYELTLSRRDVVKTEHGPAPTPECVERVLSALVTPRETMAGLALVRDTRHVFRRWGRLRKFQVNLMTRLLEALKLRHPEYLKAGSGGQPSWRDAPEALDLSVYPHTIEHMPSKKSSVRTNGYLHWDWDNWPFISFIYQAFVNVRRGRLQLCDVRVLAEEKKIPVADLLEWVTPANRVKNADAPYPAPYLMVKPEYSDRRTHEGSSALIDVAPGRRPLVIVHNQGDVAHGPAPMTVPHPTRPSRRTLHHVALVVYSKPEPASETNADSDAV